MDYDPHSVNQEDEGFQPKVTEERETLDLIGIQLSQLPKGVKVKKVVFSRLTRLVLSEDNRVYRWLTQDDAGFVQLQFPERKQQNIASALMSVGVISAKSKEKGIQVRRVFIDTEGYHSFVATEGGSNFYMHYRDPKMRHIGKLQGVSVKCLDFVSASEDRCEVVIGSDNGVVLRVGMDATVVRDDGSNSFLAPTCLVKLNTSNELTGLNFVKTTNRQNFPYIVMYALTSVSLFILEGVGKELDQFIFKYSNKDEVPSEHKVEKGLVSSLVGQTSRSNQRVNSLMLCNGRNLTLIEIDPSHEKVGEGSYASRKHMRILKKYEEDERNTAINEMFLAYAHSDYYYFLLYAEGLTVINKITEKLVKHEDFKAAIDMAFDEGQRTLLVHSSKQASRLEIENQEGDCWPQLIQRKKYRQAYVVSKYLGKYVQVSATYYADEEFGRKNYVRAAQLYAESVRSLEQTVLKFMQVENRQSAEGLFYYLKIWLVKLRPEEKAQRTLILSMMVESLIFYINYLEAQLVDKAAVKLKQKQASQNWEWLLSKYLPDLNESVVYQITHSHGRLNECLNFAEKKGNYKLIIQHYINMGQYGQALNYLKKIKDKSVVQVYYQYSYLLLPKMPELSVELLIKHLIQFKPLKLVPGLLGLPESSYPQACTLLGYCAKAGSKDKTVGNLLLYFIANSRSEEYKESQQLIQLLKQGNYDQEFALRLFEQTDYIDAQITILGMLQMETEAVTLALENNKIELAKQFADKPINDDLRKKLWLKVASHILNAAEGDVRAAIELTKGQGPLRIQDLLPLFNQNIRIQHFKQQICNALKKYSDDIQQLKKEMLSYSENAQQLKNQLRVIRNRSIELDSSHKCEECYKSLFAQQFYIFPCMHGFHKNCLLEAFKLLPRADIGVVNTLIQLDNEIIVLKHKMKQKSKESTEQGSSFFGAFGLGNFFSKKPEQNVSAISLAKDEIQLKEKRMLFDNHIAKQCIYCGPGIVDSILAPFEDEAQRKSWQI